MLASVDHGFVLLLNRKVGSTSLEKALQPFATIQTGGDPDWKHINYFKMKDVFCDFFERNKCKIYTVVRDPIDTLVSWYRYRSRNDLKDPKHPRHHNYTGNISFEEFVEEWCLGNTSRASMPVSVEFCFSDSGEIAPITYYRYNDINKLQGALEGHVGQKLNVPKLNKSPSTRLVVDREALMRLPKMEEKYALYHQIPFVD
jgi:hypothetical protein